MNDQIAAVEEMSQNIEKDFRNSKMVNDVSYGASKTHSWWYASAYLCQYGLQYSLLEFTFGKNILMLSTYS